MGSVRPLSPALRTTLWVFATLAFGAGVLLFVLATETEDSFAWTIEPPLTAAFLGAAYWAALVLIAWTARQTEWARARAALLPVLLIAVLLLAATLVHLDKFDLDSLFGWFWLTAYCVVPPLLVALIVLNLRAPGSAGRAAPDLPAGLRALLGLQAAVMLAVGVALFAAPSSADSFWPWPLTPLTARAVGAFVIGFGAAAAYGAYEADSARLRGSAWAYLTLGLLELAALALHSEDLAGPAGSEAVYIVFVAGVVAAGAYGLAASSARSRS
jgi:membrane protein CcdC involved in cytochrome C biogenesis